MQIDINSYQNTIVYNNNIPDKITSKSTFEKSLKTFGQGQALEITPEQKIGNTINDSLPSTNYSPIPNKGVAPYSFLANESGEIEYKGVIYQCNDLKRSISLGSMTKQEDILTIPLDGGGTLRVNRNNFDDLSKSIGMFSAKDQGKIMRAMATDAKVRSVKNELEEEESKLYNTPQES